jgi:diadenylate cyclase
MAMFIYDWVKEIGISGFIDIIVMSVLLYSILIWMKRTQRAAAIITGIVIVAIVFLIARQFNLLLTTAILQGFFAVILITLIVIFQEELRYFFERVSHWSLNRRLPRSKRRSFPSRHYATDVLVRTLTDLAREKIGALVVIRGKDIMNRHLDGCELLNGRISEKVLKSIFDPHSIGHDGAVLLEDEVIKSFSCHLPLSKNHEQLNKGGTRHAAALGISELTDALSIVVSEERGTVSVARNGSIREVQEREQLSKIIESFYLELRSNQKCTKSMDFFRWNYREKILAVSLAMALWFVLVHEARIVYKAYNIPVHSSELLSDMEVTQIEPKEVEITLSGQRKSFYFLDEDDIKLILKPWQLKVGKSVITLSGSDFTIPEGLEYEDAVPREVAVTIASQINKAGDRK